MAIAMRNEEINIVENKFFKNKWLVFLIALIGLGQLASDLYLPSLPVMKNSLFTTISLLQLTISFYFLGYSISQLFYGPMSDSLGRVFVLKLGLSIFLIGTLICLISPNITLMIVGRVIQGLGIGSVAVSTRAIARDIFSGKELVNALSYIGMATAIIPAIAPVLGGFIQVSMGWRANFILLAILGLILFTIVEFFISETNRNLSTISIKQFVRSFLFLLTQKSFLTNLLCIVCSLGGIIAFNTTSPFLLQNLLGFSPFQYGTLMILIAGSFFVGNFLNQFLISKLNLETCIMIGVVINLFAAVLFLVLGLVLPPAVWSIVFPMCLYAIGTGIVLPCASAGAMMPFANMAGIAGALMGFAINLSSALVSAVIAKYSVTNQIPVATMITVLSLLMLLIYLFSIIRRSVKIETIV